MDLHRGSLRIPHFTANERYYVATCEKWAHESWSTLKEAKNCIKSFKKYSKTSRHIRLCYERIIGIIKVYKMNKTFIKYKRKK